jgi:hypothetical protein
MPDKEQLVSTYIPDPRAAASKTDDGDDVVIVDRVNISGRTIDFPRPLPGAPEYAAVISAEAKAETLRPKLLEGLDERQDVPWQPNTPLVLDMRGAAGTAVTGAITGMEAFANHHILRSAPSETFILGDREVTVEHALNMSINERYSDVLPALLEKPKPTGEAWWQDIRRIQRLAVLQRHALYEPQSGKGLDGERSLAERVYNGEYRGAASMMVSAFEHFSPGWFSAERRQALSQPVT